MKQVFRQRKLMAANEGLISVRAIVVEKIALGPRVQSAGTGHSPVPTRKSDVATRNTSDVCSFVSLRYGKFVFALSQRRKAVPYAILFRMETRPPENVLAISARVAP